VSPGSSHRYLQSANGSHGELRMAMAESCGEAGGDEVMRFQQYIPSIIYTLNLLDRQVQELLVSDKTILGQLLIAEPIVTRSALQRYRCN
jgi:hypothetical protein